MPNPYYHTHLFNDSIEIGLDEVIMDYSDRFRLGPDGGFMTDEFRTFASEVAQALVNVNGREMMTVPARDVEAGDYIMGRKVDAVTNEFASRIFYLSETGEPSSHLAGDYIQIGINQPVQIERPIS